MPFQIHSLMKDLAHHWWTPVPGTRYVCDGPDGITDCGPGRTAHEAPGSFNVYAGLMRLTLPHDYKFEDYRDSLHEIVLSNFVCQQVVDGWSVECWATLLKPQAFKSFLLERRSQVEAWSWNQSGHACLRSASTFFAALPDAPWHPERLTVASPHRMG